MTALAMTQSKKQNQNIYIRYLGLLQSSNFHIPINILQMSSNIEPYAFNARTLNNSLDDYDE
jgi:hypothetical protein